MLIIFKNEINGLNIEMNIEKFEQIQKNRIFLLLNYVITFLCIYFLFIKIREYEINLNFDIGNSTLVVLLICLSSIFQAIAWSKLVTGNYDSHEIYSWFNSIIGKYFPFKIGIISKRLFNKKKNLKSMIILKNIIKEQIIVISVLSFFSLYLIVNPQFLFFIFLLLVVILKNKAESKLFSSVLYCFIAESVFILGLVVFINNYIDGNLIQIVLIYMFSSVLSTFVTTAPAGFGIREYLFIVICDYLNFESNENLLLIILSFRLLIICSDLIIFLNSFFYKASLKNKDL